MLGTYPRKLYHPVILWMLWSTHFVLLTVEIFQFGVFLLSLNGDGQSTSPGYVLIFALAILNFIAEPTEFVLWSYHLLHPWVYLVLQIAKVLLWSTLMGLVIWVTANIVSIHPNWPKIVLYVLLTATTTSFYLSLIYAVYVVVRNSKTGGYQAASEEENSVSMYEDANRRRAWPKGVHPLTRNVSSVYSLR